MQAKCSECGKEVTVDEEQHLKGLCPECGAFHCYDCIEEAKVCEHMKRRE